ncbi:hypothetical protein IAU60_006898 [Kwoniella sp. DSM 27419]
MSLPSAHVTKPRKRAHVVDAGAQALSGAASASSATVTDPNERRVPPAAVRQNKVRVTLATLNAAAGCQQEQTPPQVSTPDTVSVVSAGNSLLINESPPFTADTPMRWTGHRSLDERTSRSPTTSVWLHSAVKLLYTAVSPDKQPSIVLEDNRMSADVPVVRSRAEVWYTSTDPDGSSGIIHGAGLAQPQLPDESIMTRNAKAVKTCLEESMKDFIGVTTAAMQISFRGLSSVKRHATIASHPALETTLVTLDKACTALFNGPKACADQLKQMERVMSDFAQDLGLSDLCQGAQNAEWVARSQESILEMTDDEVEKWSQVWTCIRARIDKELEEANQTLQVCLYPLARNALTALYQPLECVGDRHTLLSVKYLRNTLLEDALENVKFWSQLWRKSSENAVLEFDGMIKLKKEYEANKSRLLERIEGLTYRNVRLKAENKRLEKDASNLKERIKRNEQGSKQRRRSLAVSIQTSGHDNSSSLDDQEPNIELHHRYVTLEEAEFEIPLGASVSELTGQDHVWKQRVLASQRRSREDA